MSIIKFHFIRIIINVSSPGGHSTSSTLPKILMTRRARRVRMKLRASDREPSVLTDSLARSPPPDEAASQRAAAAAFDCEHCV